MNEANRNYGAPIMDKLLALRDDEKSSYDDERATLDNRIFIMLIG